MACRHGVGSTEHSSGSIKEPGPAVMKIELLEGERAPGSSPSGLEVCAAVSRGGSEG